MKVFQSKMTSVLVATIAGIALAMPGLCFAQSEQTVPNDQPYRVAIIYIPPSDSTLRGPYDV